MTWLCHDESGLVVFTAEEDSCAADDAKHEKGKEIEADESRKGESRPNLRVRVKLTNGEDPVTRRIPYYEALIKAEQDKADDLAAVQAGR